MKRIWTLEESLVSPKLLLVSSKNHWWWYLLVESEFPIFHDSYRSAASILYSAHARISSREYDCIFALANVFPEIMNEIRIDYNQDIQELMMQFYVALAKKDLSILCFQKHDTYKGICQISPSVVVKDSAMKEPEYKVPIQKFDLPSWTGVGGEHYSKNYRTSFKNYNVNGRLMEVTCTAMTNNQYLTDISNIASITEADLLPVPQDEWDICNMYTLVIPVRSSGSTEDIFLAVHDYGPAEKEACKSP